MHTYKLTSTHTIYFNGKLEVLNTGDTFVLAGLQLSSFGNKSPFYYKDDIIRLPNSILECVDCINKEDDTDDTINQKIKEIINRSRIWPREYITIKEFISKCSLTDFEILKDLEYDETYGNS